MIKKEDLEQMTREEILELWAWTYDRLQELKR